MRWRSVLLGALAIALGAAAAVCVATQIRLSVAMSSVFSTGDTGLTQAQVDKITDLSRQLSTVNQLDFPLVAGSLVCSVALLVVLAWRWQVRGRGGQS